MSNYVNNLNELINTKKELKDIIIESTGENPSEVFSYYPSYIRSAIAAGSASEEAVNSYISAYLSAYNYIDQDTLSSNSYITESDVAQMGYITMGDVSACGYLTQHQDLSSYATKSYVVDYVATYAPTPDLSSYVTKTELSAQSYLTSHQDLSGYVSKTELSSCGYITMDDVSSCGYITINDVPSTDLSGYVSKTELSAQSYITMGDVSACGYITSIPSEYITQTELSSCGYITSADIDLSDYVTYSYATANYVSYSYAYNTFVSYSYLGDIEEITEYILGSGSSSAPENIYATKSELNSYVSKTSLESMSYITMDDIDACGYITASDVDMSGYLPLTGGEVTGPLYITYQQTNNALYGFKSYSHIVAGDENKTTPAFLASKRYCANGVGSYINMASFFVNSDGRAKFAHKASGGGGGDDAFMCFNAYGFKIAYSGAAGVSASTEYDLIHSGNINNYISGSAVIDEDLIPKETGTYTLGDSSYLYATSYITDMWLGAKNKFSNRSDNQVNLMLNNGWKYTFHSNGLSPANDNNQNLGSSTSKWKASYSYNYYFGYNTAISSDSDYGVQLTINGNKNYQWNMYQFTMTNNNYRNQCSLGTSGNQWAYTYTKYLILDGTNIMDIIGDIETLLSNI